MHSAVLKGVATSKWADMQFSVTCAAKHGQTGNGKGRQHIDLFCGVALRFLAMALTHCRDEYQGGVAVVLKQFEPILGNLTQSCITDRNV